MRAYSCDGAPKFTFEIGGNNEVNNLFVISSSSPLYCFRCTEQLDSAVVSLSVGLTICNRIRTFSRRPNAAAPRASMVLSFVQMTAICFNSPFYGIIFSHAITFNGNIGAVYAVIGEKWQHKTKAQRWRRLLRGLYAIVIWLSTSHQYGPSLFAWLQKYHNLLLWVTAYVAHQIFMIYCI